MLHKLLPRAACRLSRLAAVGLMLLTLLGPRSPFATSAASSATPASLQTQDEELYNLDWISGDADSVRAMALGDVDLDGDLDLAAANDCAGLSINCGYVRLYHNDGGRFREYASWSLIGAKAGSGVAWGDVDKDGDLDLAVALLEGPAELHLNDDGVLSTSPGWTSGAVGSSSAVAWGDYDGDADLDLAVGGEGDVPARLFSNEGGVLAATPGWTAVEGGGDKLAWVDVDRDGDVELAILSTSGGVRIYDNLAGSLGGTPRATLPAIGTAYDFAWGDADQDRDLDLIVLAGTSSFAFYANVQGDLLYRGTGDGGGRSVAWADADYAGWDYVALAGAEYYSGGNPTVASFGYWDPPVVSMATVWSAALATATTSVVWGDINADGILDLVAGTERQRIRAYVRYTPSWEVYWVATPWFEDALANAQVVAWGDVDKDGFPELAVAQRDGKTHVYRNVGGSRAPVLAWSSSEAAATTALAWADVDGDHDLDLAAAGWNEPLRIYHNLGGALSPAATWQSAEPLAAEALAWGDYDVDGDLDLAVANVDQPRRIYHNREGVLETTASWVSAELDPTRSLAWGDYDGDGDLDLVAGNACVRDSSPLCRNLRLYYNQGGALSPRASWSSSEALTTVDVAWGDYDGDGDLDLATANELQDVRVYANEGGDLSERSTWAARSSQNSRAVAWIDYDNDGDLDLATSSTCPAPRNCTQLFFYHNDKGALQSSKRLTLPLVGGGSGAFSWADYDADGDYDAAVVSGDGKTISFYPNRHVFFDGPPRFVPNVAVGGLGASPLAEGFSSPEIQAGRTISIPFTLTGYRGQGPASVVGQYSLDGGGHWQPAVPANVDDTRNLVSSVSHTSVFSMSTPAAIPDLQVFSSTLEISSTGTIDQLAVAVRVQHPTAHRLRLWLTGPAGQTVLLSQEDTVSGDGQETLFTDGGFWPDPAGTVRPREPLAVFGGLPISGTWTLSVLDPSSSQAGTLLSWGLRASLNPRVEATRVVGLAIPERGAVTSTLTLTGTGLVGDLDLRLNITHPRLQDLVITLTSPTGESSQLIDCLTITSGCGLVGADLKDVILDDNAWLMFGQAGAPYTGRFRPNRPLTAFAGAAISGTWTLKVEDIAFPLGGALVDWGLSLRPAQPAQRHAPAPIEIPPGGTMTTTLTFTEPGHIQDLDVPLHFNFPHAFPEGDVLEFSLVSPSGRRISLMRSRWLESDQRIDTILDDEGAYPVEQTFPPARGRYQPTQPLRIMDGELLAGAWSLVVLNKSAQDSGWIQSWGLEAIVDDRMLLASHELPGSIPKLAQLSSTQLISRTGEIRDIDITLELDHPRVRDLRIALQPPAGEAILLVDQRGAPGQAVERLVLDDQADLSVSEGLTATSRRRPEQPLGTVPMLGDRLRGPWTLRVEDLALGETGQLRSWSMRVVYQSGVVHTYVWDLYQSGVMGRSDNVVLRLLAMPDLTPQAGGGSDPAYYGVTLSGGVNSYRYGATAGISAPFRVRGTQVQVLHEGQPAPGALVYHLPAGQQVDGELLMDAAGAPFTTDAHGFLQGRGALKPGDQLFALLPVSSTGVLSGAAQLYYTNGAATPLTLEAFTVDGPGVQTIEVSAGHPLYLFDLDVSLEWDASADPAYLQQLEFNLKQASRYLYDFSDGQLALGHVEVYQSSDNWAVADLVVHATNRLRPFATQGGVVVTPTRDLQHDEIVYDIGQVHMGATWNRYGIPGQNLGADWPLVLAHELGHYLLFQDDTYLGRSAEGLLNAVETCTGSAMGDVYQPANTELLFDRVHWLANCAGTLAHQELGRTEWETLGLWYPTLVAPTALNDGPALMLFNLTSVQVHGPLTPTAALDDPSFTLSYSESGVSSSQARAFLLRGSTTPALSDDYLLDLGTASAGQNRLLARGARPGDRLCVFDRPNRYSGCEVVTLGDAQLALADEGDWSPLISLTPATSTTLAVEVGGLPAGLALSARLFPEFGAGTPPVSLTPGGGVYSATLGLPYPVAVGHLQLWAGEGAARREIVLGYTLGGNPGYIRGGTGFTHGGGYIRGGTGYIRGGGGYIRGGGGYIRGGTGYIRGGTGPLVSPDGQMSFLPGAAAPEGTLYTLQSMPLLPPLPAGKVAIGQSYALVVTQASEVMTGSVSFQYLNNDVLLAGAREDDLRIHFWDGARWQVLPTLRNATVNMAAARSMGGGTYALLAGVTVPQVTGLSPRSALATTTTTLVLSGTNFLAPASLVLSSGSVSLTLEATVAGPGRLAATLPPALPPGAYQVTVVNGDGGRSPAGQELALVQPSPGCFYDFFESGLAQWTLGGRWGVTTLAGGAHALTDSPELPYASATPPDLLRRTSATSRPFSLAGCVSAVLELRHDYVLAPGDSALVEVSADGGASWRTVARFSGGRPRLAALAALDDEWADVAWLEERIVLAGYTGQVQLRFTLEADRQLAERGWLIDSLVVRRGSVLLPLVQR